MKSYTAVVDAPMDEAPEYPDSPGGRMPRDRGTRDTTEGQVQQENAPLALNEGEEALVRRIYDQIINQGNMQVAEEIIAPDLVDHVPHLFPGQPVTGAAALTWIVSAFRTAFPDLHAAIDDVVVAGDRVCVRSVWAGTHQGQFLGIDPTGRRIKVQVIEMARVVDGVIVEHWGEMDMLGMLKQLDLMPGPMGTPG